MTFALRLLLTNDYDVAQVLDQNMKCTIAVLPLAIDIHVGGSHKHAMHDVLHARVRMILKYNVHTNAHHAIFVPCGECVTQTFLLWCRQAPLILITIFNAQEL